VAISDLLLELLHRFAPRNDIKGKSFRKAKLLQNLFHRTFCKVVFKLFIIGYENVMGGEMK